MAAAEVSRAQKQRLQLALDEEEMRQLKVPVNRGSLSPSKNSFLPTLQEELLSERPPTAGSRAASASGAARPPRPGSQALGSSSGVLGGAGLVEDPVSHFSPELLESVRTDFESAGGSLSVDYFVKSVLRSVEPGAYGEAGLGRVNVRMGEFAQDAARLAGRAAGVVDLFRRVDVHSEGRITWEQVSNHLIESGMSGGEAFTVDTIKSYEASPTVDSSKHDSDVEKLVYLEKLDTIAVLSSNSRIFRLMDPKTLRVRHEVSGHRGTIVNCCYVESHYQIASTAADMTICLWDDTTMALRNRMSAKELQLSLQYVHSAKSLFSGSIDGTLSRWDLQGMCLADVRRGQHKQAINELLPIEDIHSVASASSDGTICMWDIELMRPKKVFKGHRKGAFNLSYSTDYRCLFTAGLDQEALAWNPYVEKAPIFRLKGHSNALCGVGVVPGTPQVLTADVLGTFKLWDVRNFRCVQTFGGNDPTSTNELSSFCVLPVHRRLAAGGSKVLLYDYMDDWNGESVTDTNEIADALYNPRAGEFYTVSKTSVKAWRASTGSLFKVLRDISPHEITAICLSDNSRKLYVGDTTGKVSAHKVSSGMHLTEFQAHNTDISCLAVWPGTNKLFSACWDGVVKIQTDEKQRTPQLKAEFRKHRDGVTCLACSPELMLLATGGADTQVCLYDLKTLKFEHSLMRMQHVISGLDFLGSRCLLAVADQGGYISLWRVRPHAEKWTRVFYFKNSQMTGTIEKLPVPADPHGTPVSLRALKFAPLAANSLLPQPLLYTADTKGVLRCWDLSALCERRKVRDADLEELFVAYYHEQLRRCAGGPVQHAAAACLPAQHAAAVAGGSFVTEVPEDSPRGGKAEESADQRKHQRLRTALSLFAGTQEKNDRPLPDEVKLIFEAVGHDEAVVSLHLTESPRALLSCGQDRRVCTWSPSLENLGPLMMMESKDLTFSFPYDPSGARAAKLKEAEELLKRIGPWTPGPKLPPLARSASAAVVPAPAAAAGYPQGEAADAAAKRSLRRSVSGAASQPLLRAAAREEEEESSTTRAAALGRGMNLSGERMFKKANARWAAKGGPQRKAAMSKDEAAAADRLALAMAALGCDELGTYAALAKSIRPKVQKAPKMADEGDKLVAA